jgi:protein-S-isoprenylcysteine O-methyltransferase Ste14
LKERAVLSYRPVVVVQQHTTKLLALQFGLCQRSTALTAVMSSTTTRIGQKLFSWRSLTPVPVLFVALWLVYRQGADFGLGGARMEPWLDGAGLCCALLGQILRFYTLGWVPEGTSGQNLSIQAAVLNTGGPYAFVRNPLYVGNFGIVFGLLLIAHVLPVYGLVLLFFFGEYHFIINAEEAFLRAKFGAAFEQFCATVPRWIPRLTPATQAALRGGTFDAMRALKKEVNPFAAWVSGAAVLLVFQWWSRDALTVSRQVLVAVPWALTLALLVVVKAIKKQWIRT